MDSILGTTKKLLGIATEDTSFDVDVIVGINTALMTLSQLGVGPETGFMILDNTETWTDFIGTSTQLESVKTYVYLQTRLTFDPPSSSFVLDSINRQLAELAFRINLQAETPAPTTL